MVAGIQARLLEHPNQSVNVGFRGGAYRSECINDGAERALDIVGEDETLINLGWPTGVALFRLPLLPS